MKLVTFQTKKALAILKKKSVLCADEAYINLKKYGFPYDWMVHEMKRRKICPKNRENYPLWAWAKCGASIAPPKRKNIFDVKQELVKITFEKSDDEVLISDYMAYSFLLNGHIVPKTKAEYKQFLKEIGEKGISSENLKAFVRKEKQSQKVVGLFPKIKKTWARIFDLKSPMRQACVWNIKMSEILKIETLNDPKYIYGTMNAKRADGSRPDWKKRYLQFLK